MTLIRSLLLSLTSLPFCGVAASGVTAKTCMPHGLSSYLAKTDQSSRRMINNDRQKLFHFAQDIETKFRLANAPPEVSQRWIARLATYVPIYCISQSQLSVRQTAAVGNRKFDMAKYRLIVNELQRKYPYKDKSELLGVEGPISNIWKDLSNTADNIESGNDYYGKSQVARIKSEFVASHHALTLFTIQSIIDSMKSFTRVPK